MKTSTEIAARGLLTAALALILVACGTSASAQDAGSDEVVVTVLLYSGRPNPTFTLDQAALDQLAARVAEAPAAEDFDRGSVLPSILGYNGVVIENPSARAGLPRRMAVYGGALEIGEGRTRRFLRDAGGEIESLLIEAAESAGALDQEQLRAVREARAGSYPQES